MLSLPPFCELRCPDPETWPGYRLSDAGWQCQPDYTGASARVGGEKGAVALRPKKAKVQAAGIETNIRDPCRVLWRVPQFK